MTRYGELNLWHEVNAALDTYQADRSPINRDAYLQALDEYQAERRAAQRRAIAHHYHDDRYLQDGDPC